MDDPRFDSLAKAFARATTRRTALATLLAALSLTPTRGRAATAGCRAVVEGGVVSITRTTGLLEQQLAATTVARIPLPGSDDSDGANSSPTTGLLEQQLAATTTVHVGGTMLLEVDLATEEDGVAVRVAFGPAFGTAAEARFVAGMDGQVRGVVAGREVVPFPAAVPPATLAFADGGPPPRIEGGPGVDSQVAAALARLEAIDCPVPGRGAASGLRAVPEVLQPLSACDECRFSCSGLYGICLLGAQTACSYLAAIPLAGGLAYAACVVVAAQECADEATACDRRCIFSPVCCLHLCGPELCCNDRGSCLREGVCCAPGQTACHGVSCCNPGEPCRDDGGCCPPQTAPCGTTCCNPGEGCRDDGVCCPPQMVPCSTTCCPVGDACLRNRECCPADRVVGGRCCPRNRIICNGVCCPAGNSCVGGDCFDPAGCRAGLTLCRGRCVDLRSDPANCGRCRRRCRGLQPCRNGFCGEGPSPCPADQTACGSACVDVLTDPVHCGGCGRVCPIGRSCRNGTCA